MKRFLFSFCLLAIAWICPPEQAAAQGVSQFGFLPFGFYQPYGGTYGTSLRTPPYFASNPPVYYGTRHARPYGLSPFAAPPMVTAGENYQSRLRVQFQQPRVPTPGPAPRGHLRCNPCPESPCPENPGVPSDPESIDSGVQTSAHAIGAIRLNPYVTEEEDVAIK